MKKSQMSVDEIIKIVRSCPTIYYIGELDGKPVIVDQKGLLVERDKIQDVMSAAGNNLNLSDGEFEEINNNLLRKLWQ